MKIIRKITAFLSIVLCTQWGFCQSIKDVAHRGYWRSENSAQNSIHSLKGAQSLKCYGSEFDVWITSDKVAVVAHDPEVDGMVLEETPFEKVKAIKLKNGEYISTLKNYLKAGKKGKTRLILEVKSRYIPELEIAVAQEVVTQVRKAKVASKTEYITGSIRIAQEIVRLEPKAKIAYVAFLKTALEPKKLKELGCNGIDYHYSVYQKNPQWIKEAHDLGMEVNVWVADTEKLMTEMIEAGVDYITTDEPVLLQQVLKKLRKN